MSRLPPLSFFNSQHATRHRRFDFDVTLKQNQSGNDAISKTMHSGMFYVDGNYDKANVVRSVISY